MILSCCKMNCEWDNVKTRLKPPVGFWKPNRGNPVFCFWFLMSVRFGSVFRKPISEIFIRFCTPLSSSSSKPSKNVRHYSVALQFSLSLCVYVCMHVIVVDFGPPPPAISWCRLATYGSRAFSVAAPVCWHALPDYLKSSDLSFDCFIRQLKTFLFCLYWHLTMASTTAAH